MTAPGAPDPSRKAPLEEVLADYMERLDRGEVVDRSRLLTEHPHLAGELQSYFADSDAVALLRPGAGAPSSQAVSLAVKDEPLASLGTRVRYVGDYELLEEIASGGMGVVYRARQLSLHRLVALKMIRADRLGSTANLERFHTEAQAAAGLDHPHIVPIYEVGVHEGYPYYSMRLIEGGNLAQHLPRLVAAPRTGVELLTTAARAVHYAHQRSLLHRDLKPANILLDEEGKPHVADFGLAKRLEDGPTLTQSGLIVGTPNYMAPEQASKNSELTTAADVYSLGAILYELLTGQPPFREATPLATLVQVLDHEPVSPRTRAPGVDRDLETICLKCLRKDPQQRYDSAAALADDLQRWLDGEPILARRVSTGERLRKWARRRPVQAALAALLVVVTIASVMSLSVLWRQAEDARRRAEDAGARTERTAYGRAIALAYSEWRDNHLIHSADLLAACPEELRGWEWHYLKRLFQVRYLTTLTGHSGAVNGVAFSPDGQRLASAGADGSIRLWDRRTGQTVETLRGHTGSVLAVAFSPDGHRLASIGEDRTARLWDAASGQEVLVLHGHTVDVTSVAFSPDGEHLATAGGRFERGELRVWNLADGRVRIPEGDLQPISAICYSPDGTRLATAQGNNDIVVRDAGTLTTVLQILTPGTPWWTGIAFSEDGHQRLAAVNSQGIVKAWDLKGRQLFTLLEPLEEEARPLSFQPARGEYLATTGTGGTVTVSYAATGKLAFTVRGHVRAVASVAFSPDGRCLATASYDRTVKLWDVTNPNDDITFKSLTSGFTGVAFSPDGKRLATANRNPRIKVWDLSSEKVVVNLNGHSEEVTGVAFSSDGQRLASSSGDGTVRLWDAATGQETAKLTEHEGRVEGVAFARDGVLASAGVDGTVRRWDVGAVPQARCLRGHAGAVHAVSFSPDGQRLASAGQDGVVKVWDPASGRELLTLSGHSGAVFALSFSPDGKRLATAGADETVIVWDTSTGTRVGDPFRGHAGAVRGLAFGRGGRLASAGDDRAVRLWDVDSREEILTLTGHTDHVRGLAFSSDGHRLVSASDDWTVKVWDGTPLNEGTSDR